VAACFDSSRTGNAASPAETATAGQQAAATATAEASLFLYLLTMGLLHYRDLVVFSVFFILWNKVIALKAYLVWKS
jgi:hypothetical protein